MSSTARPGGTLHSDSVSYAVWLFGQAPRVSGEESLGRIMNRYPELTLGEARHIQSQAQSQLSAGVALMALSPGETLDDNAIPDSGSGGSGYRTQVDVSIPARDGTSTQRTVIIEDTASPSPDSVTDAIIDAIQDICGAGDSPGYADCLNWLLGDISLKNVSVSRGH